MGGWQRVPLPVLSVLAMSAGSWRVHEGGAEGWPLLPLAFLLTGAAIYEWASRE